MRLKTLLSIQLATFIYTRATINQQQLCISQKLADKNQSSKVKWQQSAVNKSSDVRGRRRFFCLPTLNSWHCRPIFLDHVIGLKTWNRITVTQSYSSFILRKAAEAALKLWIPWNINWHCTPLPMPSASDLLHFGCLYQKWSATQIRISGLHPNVHVVDSFPCWHQPFHRILWKAASDCMRNANKSKMPIPQWWGKWKNDPSWTCIQDRITTKS